VPGGLPSKKIGGAFDGAPERVARNRSSQVDKKGRIANPGQFMQRKEVGARSKCGAIAASIGRRKRTRRSGWGRQHGS